MTTTLRLSAAIGASLLSTALLAAAPPLAGARRVPAPPMHADRGLQLAGLFGESEEERIAREAREQKERDQDAAVTGLTNQIRDLEDTVRRLTGQNEVLSHKVEQFDSKVDRMQKDFDYKLCTVMAQQVAGDTASLPCGADNGGGNPRPYVPVQPSSQSFSEGAPPASSSPRTLAPPPGVLGSLPRNGAVPPPDGGAPSDTVAAAASPYRAEFDTGLNLLGKAQYDQAKAAFRAFADNHPKDDLAPQAVFWVANIAYVQKDYPNAARTFAEEIKKYPANSRAPESMLKLGQSLIAMGQKKEGCFTLGSLPATYPKAPKATVTQASTLRTAAACK